MVHNALRKMREMRQIHQREYLKRKLIESATCEINMFANNMLKSKLEIYITVIARN